MAKLIWSHAFPNLFVGVGRHAGFSAVEVVAAACQRGGVEGDGWTFPSRD